MNIYYHPLYTYGIDSNSSFPRERYELIRNSLEAESKSGLINFVEPIKANLKDIYRAHSKDYVDRFLNSNLSDKEIREIGLKPWSSAIIDRTMFLTGGSLKALEDIYRWITHFFKFRRRYSSCSYKIRVQVFVYLMI